MEHVSNLIIRKLETLVEDSDSAAIISKRKAINTLFPYAIFLEQSGHQEMIDVILRSARASNLKSSNCGKFMWHHVVLYVSRLFEKRSPTSLNRIITLLSPYVPWGGALNDATAVARWAAAASTIPYTEEVGQSVIDALFQISYVDFLRPHIPNDIWGWVKRQPPLPPMYRGLLKGAYANTVAYVRGLGDIDLLKSYLLLVWTDRCTFLSKNFREMERTIREKFGGIGMEHHRKDLIERLDRVLRRLDRREPSSAREAKTQYTRLRDLLLEAGTR